MSNSSSKYKYMCECPEFGNGIKVNKASVEINHIVDDLSDLIENSEYTFAEVADRLCWTEEQLARILSGNFDLDVFDITHIAGAAGYGIDVSFYKECEV